MKRMIVALCLVALAQPAAAQIAIDRLQIQNSPDVRTWSPTATITKIEFWRGAGIHFEFDRQATWPDVVPEGWSGPVQYTVWMLIQIGGQWYGSGVIECWRDRPSTDDADVTAGNQIARNWVYDERLRYRALSPISHVRADSPPTLSILGTSDRIIRREQSELLDQALRRVGVDHEQIYLPGNDHGFDTNWGGFGTQIVRARIEAFLRRHAGAR